MRNPPYPGAPTPMHEGGTIRRSLSSTVVVALASSLLTWLAAPAAAAPTSRAGHLGAARDVSVPHSSRTIVAKLGPGVRPADVAIGRAAHVVGRWYEVSVPSGSGPLAWARTVAARDGVEVAELDYRMSVGPVEEAVALALGTQAVPNDEHYSYQWHFPPIQLPAAWDRTQGQGAVIAILDTGVSQGGADLDCHTFVSPYDAIADVPGSAVDDNGHGTHVAGTAAQCTNNSVGVAGVAGSAQLMPIKVANANGSAATSDVAEGVGWAISHGADVINLSLGSECTSPWPACSSSVMNDAIDAAVAAGVVVVAASGNDGSGTVGTPANHPDVLAVGAVRVDGLRAPYSNGGSGLDLVAPGGDLTVDQNNDNYGDGVLQETFGPEGWGYYFIQGTSMAAPHVTGAVALLRSAFPAATAAEIRAALETTALDGGSPGFDTSYGNGLIQVASALDALQAGGGEPPPTEIAVDGTLSGGYAQMGRFALVQETGRIRYRGELDPAGMLRFTLQRREGGWRRIAGQSFSTGDDGIVTVRIRRSSSSFDDPDARLVEGERYRIRAFVMGTDGELVAADWSYFRVS